MRHQWSTRRGVTLFFRAVFQSGFGAVPMVRVQVPFQKLPRAHAKEEPLGNKGPHAWAVVF